MPLMTDSLSDSARRLGGSGYASSARRLRNKGYGRDAEQMALAGETERMQKGSGITRAEDRVVGGQIEERQAAALNKLRMQRIVSGYRGDISRNTGSTTPKTVYAGNGGYVPRTTKPAGAGSTRPSTGGNATDKPADPNWTDDPFKSAALEDKRSKEGERRTAMRAELDKVTGATGPRNAADMESQFQKERTEAIRVARERTEAIRVARERSGAELGTTRGGVIEEINKARRAAGQREFEVTGNEFANEDRKGPTEATKGRKMLLDNPVGPSRDMTVQLPLTIGGESTTLAVPKPSAIEELRRSNAEQEKARKAVSGLVFGDKPAETAPAPTETKQPAPTAAATKSPFLNLGDGPNKVGAKDARATFSVAHRGQTPEDALAWAKELASVDMEKTKKRQEALKVAKSKVTIPYWQEGTVFGDINRWGKRTLTQLPAK